VQTLATFHRGDVSAYVLVLDAFAVLAEREGDPDRAARLSGAVRALERRTGTGLNPFNRQILGFDPTPLESDDATAAAWAAGEALTADEAIAYALQDPDAPAG